MTSDDLPVGRVLSRREVLAWVGASGAMWLAGAGGCSARSIAAAPGPACVVRPEQTEGPYFVDERLNRSDVRSDPSDGSVKAGVPLALTLTVSRIGAGACEPLAGAQVDIWHCDADGVYSDEGDAIGKKFFRGYQITDAQGEVHFVTIYPGWYPGRTVHIHFKIRTQPTAQRGFDFTSQLYFDDALTDRIHAAPPYVTRGKRRTRNDDDEIFEDGGKQLLLAPAQTPEGYAASFALGLQLG
jgi:protocatechuate 3,4-dioxygenase beta subunit